jgi:hypothetical protein
VLASYLDRGYKVDEAVLMADRLTGGRPKHFPPLHGE